MNITEVRVQLARERENRGGRLKAFATVVYDRSLVITDLKVIQGTKRLHVAMPARCVWRHCPRCVCRVAVRARYCEHCGELLPPPPDGPYYADVCFPITKQARDMLELMVLRRYRELLWEAAGKKKWSGV